MLLKKWMEYNEVSVAEVAKHLKYSPHGVRKWLDGQRRPRWPVIMRIKRLTGGDVKEEDWAGKAR